MTYNAKRMSFALAGGLIVAGLCCIPASAAGLGIGASIGGSGGVNAGVGAGVGGSSGVAAGVGASIGGSRGIAAGVGASVGGKGGVSAGAGLGIGGNNGVDARLGAKIGGAGGVTAGLGASVGGATGIDAGVGIGTGPGAGSPMTPKDPGMPDLPGTVAGLSSKQLAKYRVRCQDVLKGQGSYDNSLRELCMMIQTASR